MRHSGLFAVVASLAFAGATLCAQDIAGAKFTKAKDQITFDTVVRVGGTDLQPGLYNISSNGAKVTFQHLVENSLGEGHYNFDTKQKPLTITCSATVLPKKAQETELDAPADANGVHVLKKLILQGSDVALTPGS